MKLQLFVCILAFLQGPVLATGNSPLDRSQPNDEYLAEQAKILEELVQDVLEGIPSNWTSATLMIDCDGIRINYKIKNLIGEMGKATISDKLALLSEHLYLVSSDQGAAWTQATITLTKASDEKWSFITKYTYPE